MKFIGAKYIPEEKGTRFLFITVDEADPDNTDKWKGQVLFFEGIDSVAVPSDETTLRELTCHELESYADALCQGGGIDAGFGVSGNVMQIVTHEEASLLFRIVFKTCSFHTGIPLAEHLSKQ